MTDQSTKRSKWPIALAIVAILGIATALVAISKPPDPYQFLVDLSPRIMTEEQNGDGHFIQKPSTYRELVFTPDKAARVARAVKTKLKIATDYNNPGGPPVAGYVQAFEDTNGSYVAVQILDTPHQIVMVDGLVQYMTQGECRVIIEQPIPRSGIGDAIRRFLHL